MKYKRKTFILLIMLVFILSGCSKCISTKSEFVDVTVIDEYYKESYSTPVFVGGSLRYFIYHPDEYIITVEYDGTRYRIEGASTYKKYSDRIGDTVTGILEARTYDNGSVIYDIIELE